MKTLYLDTNYLFRLYWDEPGSREVFQLVQDVDMSHDRHLLLASPLFGLRGVDVIS